LACLRALPESLGAATISEIYFGICSRWHGVFPENACLNGLFGHRAAE
jgi:hypothetical protein